MGGGGAFLLGLFVYQSLLFASVHLTQGRKKKGCIKVPWLPKWLSVLDAGLCIAMTDRSHVKVITRVVPIFSIVMRGEFSRRCVKKTGGRGLLR